MATRSVFVRFWLPALLWMVLIFSGSTDMLSSSRTSRFIGPFLRWLVPGISDAAVKKVQFTIRKGAHLTEYAVLGILLWRALGQTAGGVVGKGRSGWAGSGRAPMVDPEQGPDAGRARSSVLARGAPTLLWSWRVASLALAGAFLYAVSDEIHQSMVSSRYGTVADVFLDTAGAALGLAALWLWGYWRGRW